MANPSYRPNLNRNPTKKWAEAQSVDYEGDDWGDDDYDDDEYGHTQHDSVSASAGSQRYPNWGQPSGHSAQRSFTNPALSINTGRTSFDRDDDRRHLSAGGYDPRFQAHPSDSQFLQQGSTDPNTRGQFNPLLQVNTQSAMPPANSSVPTGFRNDHADAYDVPHSAPIGRAPQYSQPDQSFDRDTTQSQADRRQNTLGTDQSSGLSNIGQTRSLQEVDNPANFDESLQSRNTSQPLDAKPLPFIRPADIYKRVEEEREKQRRSQESPRPNIDSATGKATSPSTRSAEPVLSNERYSPVPEISASTNAKPTLDTRSVRKTEYGLSPISEKSTRSPVVSSTIESPTTAATVDAHRPQLPSRTASSVYTDRQDPTSASSTTPFIVRHDRDPIMTQNTASSPPHMRYSPTAGAPSGMLAEEQTRHDTEDLPNFDHGSSPNLSTAFASGLSDREDLRHKSEDNSLLSRALHQQTPLSHQPPVTQPSDTGNNSSLSPAISHDDLPRSNSSSTPDISPIPSRVADAGHDRDALPGSFSRASAALPETQLPSFDQAGPAVATDTSQNIADTTTLPATTFVPDHRRENISPSAQTNRDQQSFGMEKPAVPHVQRAFLPSVPALAPASSAHAQGPAVQAMSSSQETPVVRDSSRFKPTTSQSELMPPPTSRTASEDWQEWDTQRRQFNAKHGFQDSNAASPAMSSPISRAESPVKGTVRDIAGRLEGNSGRSSPVDQSISDDRAVALEKPSNIRTESFRPNLPGGWVSYTNTPSQTENAESTKPRNSQHPPLIKEHNRTESTDSIPTARAPKQWQSSNTGPMEVAFAAAAAAGNAMMGAFSGPALSRNTRQHSETSSEDEDDSEVSQPQPPEFSETRDFASSPLRQHVKTQSPIIPSPIAVPASTKNTTRETRDFTTTEPPRSVDIPAPLRTSRSDDSNKSSPRISIPSIVSVQHHHDHERLEDEIVQSLTPKTSRMDDSQLRTMMPFDRSQETNSRSSQQVSSISDEDDILPLGTRSYRDDRPVSFSHEETLVDAKNETPTKTTTRPPIPIVHIPDDTTAIPADTGTGTRPFLGQRYSWETGPDDHKKAAGPPILNFEQALSKDRPSTPPQVTVPPPSTLSPPTSVVHKVEEGPEETSRNIGHSLGTSSTPPTSATPTNTTPIAPIHTTAISRPLGVSSFPQEQTEFKDILAYKDSSQRIRAFDNNRQTYAQQSGLLEQWIFSMNTPEHRDIFNDSRTSRVSPSSATNNIRPSPRRDTTTASGSKQRQEDGKRLLAAAGKYSGKAGNVAKGIFAKGKDKLRTASSSDKVPTINRRPSNNRRRSSNYDIDPPFVPRSQESVLPDKAPQIPTPALDTPTGESWSMLSSMFQERPQQGNTEMPIRSTGHIAANGSALGSDKSPMPVHSGPRNDQSNVTKPPVSVLGSIPGSDNTFIGPQPFPDYGTGVKHEVARTTHVAPERNGPLTTQDGNDLSKVVSADDQPFRHQRVDSLPVPRARRPSSISDVSDISAAADERKDVPLRSVSPTLDSRSSVPRAPVAHLEQPSKHDEALQDRRSVEESTLPAYESGTGNVIDKRQSKIAPGAQMMPVTNPTATGAEDNQQTGSRPFSFIGSETLNHALAQQAGLNAQRDAVQQSPTEEHIRVDMEKSPQPNITEHPAYKTTGQVGQELQPENPLPSSRRSPRDFEQYRHRQQQITVPQVPPIPQGLQRGQGEEAYRIPGPYVQEYRSPRPTKPAMGQYPSQNSHDSSEHESHTAPRTQNRLSGIAPQTETSEQSSQIEQRPEFERSRSRTFGGMFRTRSKSQSRRQARDTRQSSSQGLDNYPDDGKRRKGLFGLGNRSSSPSGRVNDSQGQSSSVADSGRGRKYSMDMLRPANGKMPQTDSKKKRSSGFSSLFGKSGTKDRDDYGRDDDRRSDYRRDDERRGDYRRDEPIRDDHRREERRLEPKASFPLSSNPQQDYRNYNQYSSNLQQPTSSVEQNYGPVNTNQTAYPQYTSPIGPMQGPSSMPGTAYQETKGYYAPGDQHAPSGQVNAGNWQSVSDRPQIYTDSPVNAMTAVPRASNLQQPSTDTHVPPVSTSPTFPVTRTNRDISYGQERPYAPPTSEAKPDMADHVKNLHKRSRSPRLGRPPSDEHLHGSLVDQNAFSPIGPQAPQNPAAQLGMFQNKKISPGGGVQRSDEEQEKPWTIGLPDGGEEDSSDGDRHRRRQQHLHDTHGRNDTFTQSDIVSPSTPRQHDQRDNHGGIVSPVTTVEPRAYNSNTSTSAPTKNDAFTSSQYQPQHREHINVVEQQPTVTPAPVPQISVPPTLSNAGQIPNPQPRAQDIAVVKPTSTRQSLDLNPQMHSTASPQTTVASQFIGPKEPGHNVPNLEASNRDQHTLVNPSSTPPPSQASRTLKRISIERTPENYQTASPVSSRPLTVAEKVMGIQPAARVTVPEHRSTTPIPKSPAPSLGAPPKTTTWPDNMPSTAAISTTNTTPTTVTTTTMRSGSKLSKGSLKTKSYVIDSNTPSRSNSTAAANSSRRLVDSDQSIARSNLPATLGTSTTNTTAGAAPKVEPITTNTLQTTAGSKRSINGPPVPSHGKSFEAFELPGSRPDGYESEEEIVMSATAYPGQEWMPEYAQGVHWDD